MLAIFGAAILSKSQQPDGYDTLWTRGGNYMLAPKYDTIHQLKEANQKADSILCQLNQIKVKLGIKDTINDTIK